MKLLTFISIIVVFALGWMLNDTFESLTPEKPGSITGSMVSLKESISHPYISPEKDSPSDLIKEEDIHVYSDKVVIEIDSPEWASFADTNSMDPVFDKGSNAIQIVPKKPEQINPGDIISFESEYDSGIIIHRVIETGVDESGWYAITKGDNNNKQDPGKVRFNDIRKLLVGIIY